MRIPEDKHDRINAMFNSSNTRARFRRDTFNEMITHIEIYGTGLTAWEEKFVEEVQKRFEERGWTSDREWEILVEIHTRRVT